MRVVRILHGQTARWGEHTGETIRLFDDRSGNLAGLLAARPVDGFWKGSETLQASSTVYLSPVTEPCSIVCQGKNYVEHILETGIRPEDKDYNLLFMKAASSLSAPFGRVIRPRHVRLLDYELELGIIIGRDIVAPVDVRPDEIGQYAAGLVMANDISARDVQIPQGQWFKGKSYRTFCPAGPFVHLLEGGGLPELVLELRVNGRVRQKTVSSNMIYPPHETISEISRLMDLRAGDLILTGTPGGVAMKAPAAWKRNIFGLFFSEKKMMELFVKGQRGSPAYLKDGDIIESTIRSEDGSVDLGTQRLEVAPSVDA